MGQNKNELKNLLTVIAKELSPQYKGMLRVREHKPNYDIFISGDHEFQYIEEVTKNKVLGFIPWSKKKKF